MARFWQLLEDSVFFQGLLVVMVFGTVCLLVIRGQDVPKEFWAMSGVIVGFFFTGKATASQQKIIRTIIQELEKKG
jgi:nucleoside diphosphate kinase